MLNTNSSPAKRPKKRPAKVATRRPGSSVARNGGEPLAHADALFRAAFECCRQHERYSRIVERGALPSEERCALEMRKLADKALAQMSYIYERAIATAPSSIVNDPWLRRSNAVWLAGREFAIRHSGTHDLTRRLSRRSSGLETLHMEFELEASALLALSHACSDYRKARPEAL